MVGTRSFLCEMAPLHGIFMNFWCCKRPEKANGHPRHSGMAILVAFDSKPFENPRPARDFATKEELKISESKKLRIGAKHQEL